MEDLPLNKIDIFSDKETYELIIDTDFQDILKVLENTKAVVIDKNVFDLYNKDLNIQKDKVILIDALEDKKRPEYALEICEKLMHLNIKRKDIIIAIGGGITQDLVTFAMSILFRGIKWIWLPTTLLAQADSCIGGKSSLNFKEWKNIIGNFYPPSKIFIFTKFLSTLKEDDIRSGIGEILKVHLLSGKASTNLIIQQLNKYKTNKSILSTMIYNSLKFKNKILEIDPLDQGERLKMNYGHSFGHALESATNFGIPHGIAVNIGLDIANFIAYKIENINENDFNTLHDLLFSNLKQSDFVDFDFDTFKKALKKDKKNDSDYYNLIIPICYGEVALKSFKMDNEIEIIVQEYLEKFYKGKI
jgi:3-dehydroquinate synthase